MYLAVISLFFWEIQMLFFFSSLSVSVSLLLTVRKEGKKGGSKMSFGSDTHMIVQ